MSSSTCLPRSNHIRLLSGTTYCILEGCTGIITGQVQLQVQLLTSELRLPHSGRGHVDEIGDNKSNKVGGHGHWRLVVVPYPALLTFTVIKKEKSYTKTFKFTLLKKGKHMTPPKKKVIRRVNYVTQDWCKLCKNCLKNAHLQMNN